MSPYPGGQWSLASVHPQIYITYLILTAAVSNIEVDGSRYSLGLLCQLHRAVKYASNADYEGRCLRGRPAGTTRRGVACAVRPVHTHRAHIYLLYSQCTHPPTYTCCKNRGVMKLISWIRRYFSSDLSFSPFAFDHRM